MIRHLPKVFLGVFITWLVMKKKVEDLKFEKDLLLDFNEKQIRMIEELQIHETELSLRLFHAEHPELEDQVLEAEFVE